MKWLKILIVKPICLILVLAIYILKIIVYGIIAVASLIQSIIGTMLVIVILAFIVGLAKPPDGFKWYHFLFLSPVFLFPQLMGLVYGILEIIQEKLIEL